MGDRNSFHSFLGFNLDHWTFIFHSVSALDALVKKETPPAIEEAAAESDSEAAPAPPDSTKVKEDALTILTAYLKTIKPPTEDELLEQRREKLERAEAEYDRGKKALQTLGIEIQVNMKKLKSEHRAATDTFYKRELKKNIDKVTTGSRALIQIGQKMAAQKQLLSMERQLLTEDLAKRDAANYWPITASPTNPAQSEEGRFFKKNIASFSRKFWVSIFLSIDWLIDPLIDWSIDWLIHWSIRWLIDWFIQ